MISWLSRLTFFFISLFSSVIAIAATESTTPSIGHFAADLMEPVGILGNFMRTASLMLGVMCLFSAFLRYMQHRVNRLASPLSGVITMIILAIFLLCLPFLHLLLDIDIF